MKNLFEGTRNKIKEKSSMKICQIMDLKLNNL